jgi:hypothetical protein
MFGDGWDGEGQARFRSVYPSGHAPPNCSLSVNKHCPPDAEHVADAESAGASTASVAVSRTALSPGEASGWAPSLGDPSVGDPSVGRASPPPSAGGFDGLLELLHADAESESKATVTRKRKRIS